MSNYRPPVENWLTGEMLRECERLCRFIKDAEFEHSGVEEILRDARFLDPKLREILLQNYRNKLAVAREQLREIQARIAERDVPNEPSD